MQRLFFFLILASWIQAHAYSWYFFVRSPPFTLDAPYELTFSSSLKDIPSNCKVLWVHHENTDPGLLQTWKARGIDIHLLKSKKTTDIIKYVEHHTIDVLVVPFICYEKLLLAKKTTFLPKMILCTPSSPQYHPLKLSKTTLLKKKAALSKTPLENLPYNQELFLIKEFKKSAQGRISLKSQKKSAVSIKTMTPQDLIIIAGDDDQSILMSCGGLIHKLALKNIPILIASESFTLERLKTLHDNITITSSWNKIVEDHMGSCRGNIYLFAPQHPFSSKNVLMKNLQKKLRAYYNKHSHQQVYMIYYPVFPLDSWIHFDQEEFYLFPKASSSIINTPLLVPMRLAPA